jgi:peptidoglycan hydrolase-like protein with peptidoglycan-binding domain
MHAKSPIRILFAALLCGLLWLSAESAEATTTPKKAAKSGATASKKSSSPSKKSATHKKKRSSKRISRKRGQKAIDSERAEQIQEALIREHYLKGEPSGKWDDATQTAMRRYQADNGWQNKTVPDSRALIKLGLGPNHDHLLNPETAMTTSPAEAEPAAKPATSDPPTPSVSPAESTPPPQP